MAKKEDFGHIWKEEPGTIREEEWQHTGFLIQHIYEDFFEFSFILYMCSVRNLIILDPGL